MLTASPTGVRDTIGQGTCGVSGTLKQKGSLQLLNMEWKEQLRDGRKGQTQRLPLMCKVPQASTYTSAKGFLDIGSLILSKRMKLNLVP